MKWHYFAIAVVLGICGCTPQERERAQDSASKGAEAVKDTSSRVANTAKVKSALVSSNKLDASRIDVDTLEDGSVYLFGFVESAEDKATAVRIAEDIAGGEYKIVDRLEVKPD